MVFLCLGFINARRSLARSLFAILSMAIAAGFLTYSISLSRGYPLLFKADSRAIVGGEAVIFARQFGGRIPEGDSVWEHSFFEYSYFSDLELFHPELLKHGYLSSEEGLPYFTAEDQQRVASAHKSIKAVYPRYQLPAKTIQGSSALATPLHGRVSELDAMLTRKPEELLVDGRWFNEEDAGQAVAILSETRSKQFNSTPYIGEVVTVAIPRFTYYDGELVVIEGDPIYKELSVIGLVKAVSRYISGSGGDLVPVYWELDEIQIPYETWQQWWQEAGGESYQPEQLSIILEEQAYLEDIIYDLVSNLPEYTIYSTATHFSQAEQRGLIDTPPVNLQLQVENQDTQAAMPLDLRLPFTLLIFFNAALIVAANLLIMVSERAREVGILKAVGSTRPQIIQMVIAEALLISFTGSLLGFLFFRFPATLAQMTNGLSAATIGLGVLSDASIVFGSTLLFSAIFGILPGLRMAGLSVMEVLRGE